MNAFDTCVVVDWSAGKRSPARPSRDAIWAAIARSGDVEETVYHRSRMDAEVWLGDLIETECRAGRRALIAFDFPFGCPSGVAQAVTGRADPLGLWDWLETRITDTPHGDNNRFEVAEALNACFSGPGPFWGKTDPARWPGVPYRKQGIVFDPIAERRRCDLVAKAASSCFQLAFPPTVGSQMLMGLPMLARLRRRDGVAVWPFEDVEAPVVLAEIWPGLIEAAVREVMAAASETEIRDRVQVQCLARALSRLPEDLLAAWLRDVPEEGREEAWILGAGHASLLDAYARPALRNDCFALPPGVHWTPVDEALSDLRSRMEPVTGCETVPLDEALGRILAEDAHAVRAHPPRANTAVDGYGFAGGRGSGLHRLPLVDWRVAAGGRADRPVPEGHAVRILTGAILPPGVDTVILQEDAWAKAEAISFHGPVKAGANTRASGEDMEAGAVLLKKGRRITPGDLAMLAASGLGALAVHRMLRVGVLSTGAELRPAGTDAADWQVYDANRPMLLGILRQLGHAPVDLGHVDDDRAQLRARLDSAEVDAVLTSGGASGGDEDHVSALLRDTGSLALWRIAIKPGRPLALGVWQGRPVFGLPGNPVAAMVCTLVFARPALAVMAGQDWPERAGFQVPAAFSKRKKPGRREFLRARLRDGAVEIFPSEGSGRASGLSWAQGLVELPDGAAEIRPGDPVHYIPWAGFGL